MQARGQPIGAPPPASQWQWSSGRSGDATSNGTPTSSSHPGAAPPVRFVIAPPARPLGPPPRAAFASAPPTTGAAAPGGNTKWPDSLHEYVKRAFSRCKGAADQTLTQNALKDKITHAITTNSLWTRNWLIEPLPTLVGDTAPAPMHHANVVASVPAPPAFKPRSVKDSKQNTVGSESYIAFNPSNAASKKSKAAKRKQYVLACAVCQALYCAMALTRAMRMLMSMCVCVCVECSEQQHAVEAAELQRKDERRQRFFKDQAELARHVTPTVDTKKLRVLNDDGALDLDAMVIKGTNETVEKEYLRLTSAPHPSTVRPERVLVRALELVRSKWKAEACDYIYACSQLKSIRQDCTVQHIKNEFTVRVYESHARIALESGDINEFNQCQTQLHELYEQLIPGEAIEFLAYRILYSVYVALQAKKVDSTNAGQLAMYSVLASATSSAALRTDPAIAHALAVRAAVSMNNYHRFFQLYVDAPNMAGYLMDPMVPTMRLRALRVICKAYVRVCLRAIGYWSRAMDIELTASRACACVGTVRMSRSRSSVKSSSSSLGRRTRHSLTSAASRSSKATRRSSIQRARTLSGSSATSRRSSNTPTRSPGSTRLRRICVRARRGLASDNRRQLAATCLHSRSSSSSPSSSSPSPSSPSSSYNNTTATTSSTERRVRQ